MEIEGACQPLYYSKTLSPCFRPLVSLAAEFAGADAAGALGFSKSRFAGRGGRESSDVRSRKRATPPMKTMPAQLPILLVLTAISLSTLVQGERLPWEGHLPPEFKWEGTVNDEKVQVTIKMGEFDLAKHEVKREKTGTYIIEVDGYPAKFAEPHNGKLKPHITSWEIQWGDQRVDFPKGVYTSVFLPYLKGPAKELWNVMKDSELWIGPSDDGTSLLVIMMSGFDAQHERLAFVITKEGKAHRFSFGGES